MILALHILWRRWTLAMCRRSIRRVPLDEQLKIIRFWMTETSENINTSEKCR